MIGAWFDPDTMSPADAPEPALASPEAPGTPPPGSGGIDQLAFLVGGTWKATVGGQTAAETCVWGAGNQSIRTTVVMSSTAGIIAKGHGRFNCSPAGQLLSHSDIESAETDQRMYAYQVPLPGPVHGALNQWQFQAVFLTDAGVQHRQMVLSQLGPDAMRMDQSMVVGGTMVHSSATYSRKP